MNRLFQELKRRNVIRVAIAYVVGAWLLLQVTEVLSGLLELPSSLGKAVVVILAIGFPLVVAFAWVFELTPQGIKRESEVQSDHSLTRHTGKRLNILIIVMLALAAGYFFWESRLKAPTESMQVQAPLTEPVATDTPVGAEEELTSIAVLPFANMSTDPENEYFADGLSEEILNQLAQIPDLRVIARTSSFAFRDQNQDLREVGNLLDTGNILEGSVRRQGNQVRVTAQLIETETGAHLWSQTWDRQLDDVFAIQDEIARHVADNLDIVLDSETRQDMLAAGVRNVDAFVAYQKGYRTYIEAHEGGHIFEQLVVANQYFDEAIAAAPDFSDAYARKTDYYAHVVLESEVSNEERQAALDTMVNLYATAYDTARDRKQQLVIDLDRTFFTNDWSRLPTILREIFDNEGCAYGNWMELAVPFWDTSDLETFYQRQISCDPLMLLNYTFAAELKARQGDLEAARQILAKGRSVGGDHRWLRGGRRQLQMQSGEDESLLAELRESAEETAHDAEALVGIQRLEAQVLAHMGRVDEARAIIESMMDRGVQKDTDLIIAFAATGNREAANAAAAKMDAIPGGQAELIRRIQYCDCGAPFDLEATPRLAARIREAGFPWPPSQRLNYPAKDW